jgi:hypothetical protein
MSEWMNELIYNTGCVVRMRVQYINAIKTRTYIPPSTHDSVTWAHCVFALFLMTHSHYNADLNENIMGRALAVPMHVGLMQIWNKSLIAVLQRQNEYSCPSGRINCKAQIVQFSWHLLQVQLPLRIRQNFIKSFLPYHITVKISRYCIKPWLASFAVFCRVRVTCCTDIHNGGGGGAKVYSKPRPNYLNKFSCTL